MKRTLFTLMLALLLALCTMGASAEMPIETMDEWIMQYGAQKDDLRREMLLAFAGEEWDGAQVAGLGANETAGHGSAVLKQNGKWIAVLLENGVEGWRVSRRFDSLLDLTGIESVTTYIYPSDNAGMEYLTYSCRMDDEHELYVSLTFEGQDGEFMFSGAECVVPELVRNAVPELRDRDFESVALIARDDMNGLVRVDVDAYTALSVNVFSAQANLLPEELAMPIGQVSLSGLLSWMGERIAQRNEPIGIPSDGSAYALPQPQLAHFKGNVKYPVYTGPGTNYYREANGKASVSTGDWIQVFGEENGWLLVQYNVTDGLNRFGWIKATQQEAGVSVPVLSWANDEALCRNWVTTDPLRTSAEIEDSGEGQCKVLATLGDNWTYIETTQSDGTPLRAFVHSQALTRRSTYSGSVTVTADEAALYADAQGQEQIGSLYLGAVMMSLEAQDDRLRVCLWDENAADGGIADARFDGWVDASCVREGMWPGDELGERALFYTTWNPPFGTFVYDEPDGGSGSFLHYEYDGLYKLAEADGWAYVTMAPGDKWSLSGYVDASRLMPVKRECLLRAVDVLSYPASYVSGEGVALRAEPDEAGAAIASLIRGLNVFVLDTADGWSYVDTGYDVSDGARLRGYVPAADVTLGMMQEKTHPVMRLVTTEEEPLNVGAGPMFSGAECILRAVTADGEYGLCMFDLRLDLAEVPMQMLEDTGRREEWNFEGLGTHGVIFSADGSSVPCWMDQFMMEHWPDLPYDMLTPGQDVTVLAQQDGLSLIVLPGTVRMTLVVRTQDVLTAM